MNESLKHETDTEDGLRKQVFHCDKAGPLGGAGSAECGESQSLVELGYNMI